MIDKVIIKIVAFITLVGTLVAAFKIKEAKDISKGRDEATNENNKDILEDVIRKNEIADEVEEEIATSTDSERIDRLLDK